LHLHTEEKVKFLLNAEVLLAQGCGSPSLSCRPRPRRASSCETIFKIHFIATDPANARERRSMIAVYTLWYVPRIVIRLYRCY
jgi:hypothetical protein